MKMQTTALIWAALPAAARADQAYLALLNLPKAGSTEATLVVVLLVALGTAVALFEIVKVRYDRSLDRIVSDARFLQNCGRFDLDPDERRFMRFLGNQCRPFDVNELFYSLPLFEQAVDAEVAEALATRVDENELESVEMLLGSVRKKLHYGVVEQGMPITSTRNISTGQPVWILGPRKTIIAEGMVVRLHELSFAIKLSNGSSTGRSMFDSVVRLAFTRRADGIYGVDAPFVSFDPGTGTITCRHSLDLKRNQMRTDVRVETDFSISIRRLSPVKDAEEDVKPFVVRVIDLSGGGFAFITDRELSLNDIVMVSASAARLSMEGLQSKIVALSQHYGSSHAMYHGRFLNIEFAKKERIVKYVFMRLRELNQR